MTEMSRIMEGIAPLRSPAGQAKHDLDRLGFAVVESLFSQRAVAEVDAAISTVIDRLRNGRGLLRRRHLVEYPVQSYATVAGADRVWDQVEVNFVSDLEPGLMMTEVYRTCLELAQAIAGRASFSFDHAIFKAAGNMTVTPWHQDAAFRLLPRSGGSNLHFWIPLQDTTVEHGCMEFIAGSHLQPLRPHHRTLRSSGRPGRAVSLEPGDMPVVCPLRAGGVTIHTPRTLHFAGRNMTGETRKAWIIQFWTGPSAAMKAYSLRRLRSAVAAAVERCA